jgi:hypothetical protein
MKGQVLLSSIALDARGRKFSNCSSLEFNYEVKGDGAVRGDAVTGDWETLQAYVKSKEGLDLITMRRRFDLEPKAIYEEDLKQNKDVTKEELKVMQHNNFGICDQVIVKAKDEGLCRVKASWQSFAKTIDSDKAEVASYQPLTT